MVRELIVRNGRYSNLFRTHKEESILKSVEAMGTKGKLALYDNTQTKKTSLVARKKAVRLAKGFERKGWKKVTIRGVYSYGNEYPYRYEISAWGGFKN